MQALPGARARASSRVSAVGAGDVLLAGFIAAQLDGAAAGGGAARGGRGRRGLDARGRRRPLRPARRGAAARGGVEVVELEPRSASSRPSGR